MKIIEAKTIVTPDKISEDGKTTKKGGDVKVLFITPEANVWVSYLQFKNKVAIPNLDRYIGGQIHPIFYSVGDIMFGGDECTSENTVVEDFSLEANPEVVAREGVVAGNILAERLSEQAALQARRKREKRAAEELATKKAADLAGATESKAVAESLDSKLETAK